MKCPVALFILNLLCIPAFASSANVTRVYPLDSPCQHVTLKLSEDVGDEAGTASVAWTSEHKPYHESLVIPSGYWPTIYSNSKKAACLIWSRNGHCSLVLLAHVDDGPLDDQIVLIYEIRRNKWHLVNSKLSDFIFSDRGRFFMRKGRPNIIDFVYDPNFAVFAPDRYRLREFDFQNGKVKLVKSQTTRHRYSKDIAFSSNDSNKRDDPLREFGLSWRRSIGTSVPYE